MLLRSCGLMQRAHYWHSPPPHLLRVDDGLAVPLVRYHFGRTKVAGQSAIFWIFFRILRVFFCNGAARRPQA